MSANAFQPTEKTGAPPADGSPMLCMAPRGLAIYPVRYAVVPDTSVFANVNLPGHMGKNVTGVALKDHKYALRLLREGFIYVYYHGHPEGKKWDIFQVNEDAKLAQLNVKAFKKGEVLVTCAGLDHFFITQPDSQGKVDFAFSEHPWSKETLATMASDGTTRDRRMQTLKPSVWIGSPNHPHGMTLTEKNLEKVFEFGDHFEAHDQFNANEVTKKPISNEQGQHNPQTLALCTSANPFRMHHDTLKDKVKEINIAPNSQRNQPMLLALWDAVGITRELNGFAMDAAGWVAEYQELHEQKIHAADAIFNLKESFKNKAVTELTESDRHKVEALRKMEKNTQRNKMYYGDQRYTPVQVDERMAQIDQKYDSYLHSDEFKQRQKVRVVATEKSSQVSWEKNYQRKYDANQYNTFNSDYESLQANAAKYIDLRIQDLLNWIKSPELIDALTEYHQNTISDGVAFEGVVGDIIQSIGFSKAGQLVLNQWVMATSVSDENLLWRALACNQLEGISSLDNILAKAHSKKDTPIYTVTLNGLSSAQAAMQKLLDINIQSMGIVAAMNEPGAAKLATGGLEKIYNTVGVRIFQPFVAKKFDTVGRFLIEGVLAARANIDFKLLLKQEFIDVAEDVLDFAEDWVEDSNLQYIRQFEKPISHLEDNVESIGNTLEQKRKAKVKQMMKEGRVYRNKWDNLLAETDKTSINPVVEARFGMLFGVVQLVGIGLLHKQMHDNPEDKRIKAELGIAYLTLGATITETTSKYIKGVNATSNKLVPLRVAGGSLIAVAGVWQTYLDFSIMAKHFREGEGLLAIAYSLKAFMSMAATVLGILSVVGATSATVKALAARRSATGALASISRFAVGRTIMVLGLWFGLGALAIEQIILYVMDDDLQNWLEKSPFGALDSDGKPYETPFKTLEQQQEDLHKATLTVLS